MTKSELITKLKREFGVGSSTASNALAAKFDEDNYSDAVDDAERDTGWSMPVTTGFKIKWMKERAKRALFFYMISGQAHKFDYEQIGLSDRFKHYKSLIESMDTEFEKAKEDDAFEFAGVSALHMFGTKIDAGFQYEDQTGIDTTYDSDTNEVIIHPTDSD
nr:hypothetical protein 10 [bacterium]